ncbi:hypothetical protein BUALT_Bualt06G0050400 [Buddleja alternifolia]|uniref:Uncharacterized protein n=1 Tax=Buddleja alternifolia TaxID=168488 RepID=A0AAV6XNR4_9LAMI|nr:hypothetical protein BUALT_Bualt06G0050400 [Buddleja alternifolia]
MSFKSKNILQIQIKEHFADSMSGFDWQFVEVVAVVLETATGMRRRRRPCVGSEVLPRPLWEHFFAKLDFATYGRLIKDVDDNLDEIKRNTPGTEGIIWRQDLPSLCRTKDLNDPTFQLVLKETKHIPLAQGLIFNTFQQLEAPILSQFLNICSKIYVVGPLHAHLKTRLAEQTTSNGIWKEDKSCIGWLDSQPSNSVIYVSIGSHAVMTKEQSIEIWHGLVNSGTRFLYVGEVWKLGLDMKDTCDRVIVEKMINELMELRNDEFMERADKMSRLAKASVNEGGSSFQDLDRLIEDIKLMKIAVVQN